MKLEAVDGDYAAQREIRYFIVEGLIVCLIYTVSQKMQQLVSLFYTSYITYICTHMTSMLCCMLYFICCMLYV